MAVTNLGPTASVLRDVLGYELEAEADGRQRYRASDDGPGSIVDLVETEMDRGQMGVGTVHHIAFKSSGTEDQKRWQSAFADHGRNVTDIIDRKHFKSIYSREPGRILFEVATNGPGFTIDENLNELGSSLTLPGWLEDERDGIEAQLSEFDSKIVDSVRSEEEQ